jgi:sensor histidine kinase regulating citrate/malate metabolism
MATNTGLHSKGSMLNNLSINRKFLGLALALLSVVSVFIALFFPARQEQEMSKYLDEKTLVIAEITGSGASAGLVFDDAEAVSKHLQSLGNVPDVQFGMLYKPDGRLFAAWNKDNATAHQQSIAELIKASTKTVVHHGDVAFAMIPILENKEVIGKFVIGVTLQQLRADVSRSRMIALAIGAAILLVGGGIFAWQTSRIVKPIRILEAAARRVAAGDTNV